MFINSQLESVVLRICRQKVCMDYQVLEQNFIIWNDRDLSWIIEICLKFPIYLFNTNAKCKLRMCRKVLTNEETSLMETLNKNKNLQHTNYTITPTCIIVQLQVFFSYWGKIRNETKQFTFIWNKKPKNKIPVNHILPFHYKEWQTV